MVGLAAGQQVHVEVVAERGGCGYGILPVIVGELDKALIGLALDDGVGLDPSDFILLRPDLEEALAALEDLERLAIDDLRDAVRDGGDTVVKVHLAGGDVDGVKVLVVEAAATGGEGEQA